jgi:hypothetical protein
LAKQAIANKFRSIYNTEYELNISYEGKLKLWTEVFTERKLNGYSLENSQNDSVVIPIYSDRG